MKKILLVLPAAAVIFAGCSKTTTNTTTTTPAAESNVETTVPTETMTNETTVQEDGVMVGGAMMVKEKDIIDNAMGSKDHTTVVAAVKAAGLVETLKGTGPFTVFAPTNAAFEKLPAGTVDGLLKPEKKADLTKVLTYHVVPGRYTSKELKDGMKLKTVQSQELTVTYKDGTWMVNDALITIPDVISSNGVTFVIDTVLMPK